MNSRTTVLLAILAAAIMVAVTVGCATVTNNTDSNESAFSADVWKKNTDSNDIEDKVLSTIEMTTTSAANSDDALVVGAIRPIIHFDDCSVANSNEKVTPDWFVGKVFEKKTRSTYAVFSLEFVVELCDGVILYGGPMYYPGLTNVHHGSSGFGGTLEEFKEYVLANACEWELPSKEYTFPE